MNRVAMLLLAVVAAVAVTALFLSRDDETETKIGVALPLSGSMAEYGQNAKEGLTLAQEELAQTTGMKRIVLTFQDTEDAPQGTVAAVRRLIDVEGVRFIIGGLTSSGTLAAAPYAQERGVLFFTPAASAPGIPQIGNMIFRNWPPDDAMARKYGQTMAKRGIRSVAVLSVANDYGETNAKGFGTSFEAAGGTVVFRKSFPQGTTDFRAIVALLATASKADALLVIAYPDEYRAFFQELSKLASKPSVLLTSDTFYSPNLVSELGAAAEGAITAAAKKPSDDDPVRRAFLDAYGKRFKTPAGEPKKPGLVSDTAYDALKMLTLAISKTSGTPAAVSAYLAREIKDYPGAAGRTTFTTDRDVEGDLAVYQVKSGDFVELH